MDLDKNLLTQHPYQISHRKDGFWYTYIPDSTKKDGRRLIKRKNETDIDKVVITYWQQKAENPTVAEMFDGWISDKLEYGEIQKQTENRYRRQFEQCFASMAARHIDSIKDYEIEEFCKRAIRDYQLTQKGYANMRTILYGIFKRAKKKHYIEWSITEVVHDMELSRKSFRRVYHTNEELIFTEDELPKVLEKLYDNLDTLNLGLLLLFKSGIRIGELAALRPDNIGFNVIYITATEISYIDNDGNDVYEVRNFPKTEAGIREVVLKEEDRILLTRLRALNPFGRYLFERDGERILTKTFRRRLRTVCRQAGVKSKSPNKARKTYGTILLDSGIPESLVIEQMGHTNIATTKGHYYVNRKSTCQKEQELNKVCFL